MLSFPEKLFFLLLSLATATYAYLAARRIAAVINRGRGTPDWGAAIKRLPGVLVRTGTLSPTWRSRPLVSVFHALIVYGFLFFLLVDFGDLLEGFIAGLNFPGEGQDWGLFPVVLRSLLRQFADRDGLYAAAALCLPG